MLALVSANLGVLDPLHPLPPPPAGLDILSTYYTDRPAGAGDLAGWGTVARVKEFRGGPRLASKLYKCQIQHTAFGPDAEWYMWVDACVRIHSLSFVPGLVASLGGSGLRAAFVPHPDRTTVADEYEYVLSSLRRGNQYLSSRYSIDAMEAERDYFARRHNLAGLPLWCGGLWILPASAASWRFLDAWWWTVRNRNIFDQCAISPLLVESGIEPAAFKRSIYGCEFWTRVPHV